MFVWGFCLVLESTACHGMLILAANKTVIHGHDCFWLYTRKFCNCRKAIDFFQIFVYASVSDRSKRFRVRVLCWRILCHPFVTFDRDWWLAVSGFVAVLMSRLKCAKHLHTEGGDDGNVEKGGTLKPLAPASCSDNLVKAGSGQRIRVRSCATSSQGSPKPRKKPS